MFMDFRSRLLLGTVLAVALVSLGIVTYHTLVLQDFAVIESPAAEEEEGAPEPSAEGAAATEQLPVGIEAAEPVAP